MRRFSFPFLPDAGKTLPCPPEHLRHLASVLRLRQGEEIQASSGDGFVAVLKALSVSPDEILFEVLSKIKGEEIPLLATALLAELKSDAMDESIAHLAEQGIPHIIPFFAERSTPKFDAKDAEKKRLRRQKIADEAVKKVGGLYGCAVQSSMAFKNLGGWEHCPNKIIFHEAKGGGGDLSAFDFSRPLFFVIGPEGGFSPKETDFFIARGFTLASLGTRILRAPTACLAAATLIRFYTER